MKRYEFQVSAAENKWRLEDFLLEKFRHLSKMYLRDLVRDEKCEVNGRFENRGFRLRPNDFVEIEIDAARPIYLQPEPIPLEIVYEDRELLIVNKPAEMLVHPTIAVRTGTLLNALAFYLNETKNVGEKMAANEQGETNEESEIADESFAAIAPHIRAGLIHRLDKQTSGLLVVSKTARAHRVLASHFQRKLVAKRYFAVVDRVVEADEGEIDAPIGRFAETRFWNIKADGKSSTTRFWVRERRADTTLIELEPVTGRTNQLRIHLAHIGHPIVGDLKYGGREFARMCLHAYRLAFHHPSGGREMKFETELPIEFAAESFS